MIGIKELITIFDRQFLATFNTCLIGGAEEPLYTPAEHDQPAKIYFREDYLSSALHEVSHWCIAGDKRRQLEDYGYWYTPDSRNIETQKEFESVEIKPQAIECIFHWCLGLSFRVSVDNLSLPEYSAEQFKKNVMGQVGSYLCGSLPERAQIFSTSLLKRRCPDLDLELSEFLKQEYENYCR